MGVLNTTKKSTGGGGSGGDRYLGTLGNTEDAPTNTRYPNFLNFPAANKGDWVIITTSGTNSGQEVISKEEWVCSTTKTDVGIGSNWEKRFDSPISTFKNSVQLIHRQANYSDSARDLEPNNLYLVPFTTANNIFKGPASIADDNFSIEISDLVSYSDKLYYDMSASVEFTPENSGSRRVWIISTEFVPPDTPYGEKDADGRLILGTRFDLEFGSDSKLITFNEADAAKEGSFTRMTTSRELFRPDYSPFFQTIIAVGIRHTAEVPIGIISTYLDIDAYDLR